jgi:hypothetical protein
MDFDQQAGRLQPADLRMRLAGAAVNVKKVGGEPYVQVKRFYFILPSEK